MLYAAKCYWPGVTQAGLEQVAERARAGLGAGSGSVSYLGSLLFATDDLVLCLFQGPTRASVIQASDWLGIPCERLMEPIWLPSDQPIPRRSTEMTAVAVNLQEITGENREAVLALRAAPGQERFVSSVEDSLAAAVDWPEARPWYRAVFASDEPAGPVGFVMISWNCEPQPPEIIGPWLLWKLLIDQRYQGRGYATAVVREIAELVRAEGATELLTSYAPEDDWFVGFCQRLGFVPTGEYDNNGEVITRLALPSA